MLQKEQPIKSVRGTSPMTIQQPTEMHGAKACMIGFFTLFIG